MINSFEDSGVSDYRLNQIIENLDLYLGTRFNRNKFKDNVLPKLSFDQLRYWFLQLFHDPEITTKKLIGTFGLKPTHINLYELTIGLRIKLSELRVDLSSKSDRQLVRDMMHIFNYSEKRQYMLELYKSKSGMTKTIVGMFSCTMDDILSVLIEEDIKWCGTCKTLKIRSVDFHICRTNNDGLSQFCKRCVVTTRQGVVARQSGSKSLSRNFGKQMYKVLNKYAKLGVVKNGYSCFDLVNYDADELIEHIESLFLPGMDWDNYGFYGWHVDHIRPSASFTITSLKCSDFKECFSLNNLQPLWAVDNIQKADKYDPENPDQYRTHSI